MITSSPNINQQNDDQTTTSNTHETDDSQHNTSVNEMLIPTNTQSSSSTPTNFCVCEQCDDGGCGCSAYKVTRSFNILSKMPQTNKYI